jgi:hypothetical protein
MNEPEVASAIPARVEASGPHGSTLAILLKERGTLPEPEIIRIFCQVLEDLEHAHGQAMLHRDISPARIVCEGGAWKLVDYGMSKIGTVRYMSPERCQGRTLDVRSDTYSLGVVLFEAATGRVPFDAQMKFQLMEAHVSKSPPAPRGLNRQLSVEMERVILRALSKSRYQTAAAFRGALEAIAEVAPARAAKPRAEPAQQRPAGVAPAKARGRLRPVVIIVPVLVVVAAAALFFVLAGAAKVPSVVGVARDEAASLLKARGLEAVFEERDDTLPAGLVAAQEPAPDTRAQGDKRVFVYLSTGMVTVPPLGGLAVEEARARLRTLALDVGSTGAQYTDNFASGSVAATEPNAGTRLAPHARVNLLVSQGRATCPECGTRRQAGAKFCTSCGYRYL